MYAALILLVFPGLALMLNSWLMLTAVIPGYFTFKSCIKGEYIDMEELFGEEYRQYRRRTPDFPFVTPHKE